ncbi:sensor histidine kinase [Pantanalinema sp. GBBB05]|uniref:sensor histidine kinase n=1 Tax=Pantanalinema sp. GBBB05 TaxID=2604139 RepID=UPI001DE48189|nr:HAMP domain-containing histidine kinase [Pantanalinema sp. GBBB05]
MPKWLLPTLSEILALGDPAWIMSRGAEIGQPHLDQPHSRRISRVALQQVRAEREWRGAIAALSALLQRSLLEADMGDLGSDHTIDIMRSGMSESSIQGVVLSGPLPILSHTELVQAFATWTLTANPLSGSHRMPFQLLPAAESATTQEQLPAPVLPLLPGDPLTAEQFCLVLTSRFSLVMVLGESLTEEPAFMFSFAPDVVQQAWEALRPRILLMGAHQIDHLDQLMQQFPPVTPDYRTVMQFSQLMLERLPEPLEELPHPRHETVKHRKLGHNQSHGTHSIADYSLPDSSSFDVELLKAIAHEVRTPLSTIRTLTRLLLKRSDLPADVIKRLSVIDRECNEQIDRFGLIFRAVELETCANHKPTMPLTRTSLAQVFQQSIPRWQQQANQRQMTLDVTLPPKMPTIVSDPTMLDQALTSLIERFTRSLPAGSHIQVEVMLAGSQLKLQLQSYLHSDDDGMDANKMAFAVQETNQPTVKAIGQVLMFQPETGSLSLNLSVTKNLFQAMGGKLIVRQRPQQGEVMTVYLPLEMSGSSILDNANIVDV